MKNKNDNNELIYKVIPLPNALNENNDVFGGWLVSQMDLAATYYAKKLVKKTKLVTVAINNVTFKKPIRLGGIISMYCDLVRYGNTSITIHVIYTWDDPLGEEVECGTAEFVFVNVDKDGKPEKIR